MRQPLKSEREKSQRKEAVLVKGRY
uniref:Uncharacterized protein n=1 Tax=Anguilla anguilla TaxID=7936 RepID=A0A0E9PRK7_ANGAN